MPISQHIKDIIIKHGYDSMVKAAFATITFSIKDPVIAQEIEQAIKNGKENILLEYAGEGLPWTCYHDISLILRMHNSLPLSRKEMIAIADELDPVIDWEGAIKEATKQFLTSLNKIC